MTKTIGVPRTLKRAWQVDNHGRIYTAAALSGAASSYTYSPSPEKHGMVMNLKYQEEKLIARVYFPEGVDPEDIGVEIQGEIIRSKLVKDDKGAAMQLVEEFKVSSIHLVDRQEATRKGNDTDRQKSDTWGPHYTPRNKLAGKKQGGGKVKDGEGVGGAGKDAEGESVGSRAKREAGVRG